MRIDVQVEDIFAWAEVLYEEANLVLGGEGEKSFPSGKTERMDGVEVEVVVRGSFRFYHLKGDGFAIDIDGLPYIVVDWQYGVQGTADEGPVILAFIRGLFPGGGELCRPGPSLPVEVIRPLAELNPVLRLAFRQFEVAFFCLGIGLLIRFAIGDHVAYDLKRNATEFKGVYGIFSFGR